MIVAGGNYEVVWADVGVNGSVRWRRIEKKQPWS